MSSEASSLWTARANARWSSIEPGACRVRRRPCPRSPAPEFDDPPRAGRRFEAGQPLAHHHRDGVLQRRLVAVARLGGGALVIAVVEHRGEVRRDALHPARADRLDAGLLHRIEQRARRRVLRRVAAVDRVVVAGEPQRHRIGQPRRTAASRAFGLRGGSGRRALAPSGPLIRPGLSAENATSSSGWRDIARAQAEMARLNGSLAASGF